MKVNVYLNMKISNVIYKLTLKHNLFLYYNLKKQLKIFHCNNNYIKKLKYILLINTFFNDLKNIQKFLLKLEKFI